MRLALLSTVPFSGDRFPSFCPICRTISPFLPAPVDKNLTGFIDDEQLDVWLNIILFRLRVGTSPGAR